MAPDGVDRPRLAAFLDRMLVPQSEKVSRAVADIGRGCCTDGRPSEGPAYSPGVLWEGVAVGWSGYAKANRELMLRAANHLTVEYRQALDISWNWPPGESRLDAHKRNRVSLKCPWLRFFGPDAKQVPKGRRRIIYTMMETGKVHPDMVSQINSKFDELWTPTQWNAETFRDSGVTIPVSTAPLGVDGVVYRRIEGAQLPRCTLMSTSRAGEKEAPEGFIFISVGLPSFRKGFDVVARAFEDAFRGDPDVSLVCAVTHCSANTTAFSGCEKMKSKVYALEGEYDEHQLAGIYSASNAYVTASRGEGWNLPLCEAAAVGLPVICGDNTSHPEVAGKGAFFFRSEGEAPVPGADAISPWYKDVPFTVFGKKSHAELVDLLRLVRKGGKKVDAAALKLRDRVLRLWSWDSAADEISRRLLEMQA